MNENLREYLANYTVPAERAAVIDIGKPLTCAFSCDVCCEAGSIGS
jgi:hypothetical protein